MPKWAHFLMLIVLALRAQMLAIGGVTWLQRETSVDPGLVVLVSSRDGDVSPGDGAAQKCRTRPRHPGFPSGRRRRTETMLHKIGPKVGTDLAEESSQRGGDEGVQQVLAQSVKSMDALSTKRAAHDLWPLPFRSNK